MRAPFELATAFNESITAADLASLARQMCDDHVFIDTVGTVVSGKAAALEAWRGFFLAFPGYRNTFADYVERESEVAIRGSSECSDARLAGPALWRVHIRDGLIAEWQVLLDTPSHRSALGLG